MRKDGGGCTCPDQDVAGVRRIIVRRRVSRDILLRRGSHRHTRLPASSTRVLRRQMSRWQLTLTTRQGAQDLTTTPRNHRRISLPLPERRRRGRESHTRCWAHTHDVRCHLFAEGCGLRNQIGARVMVNEAGACHVSKVFRALLFEPS